MVIDAIKNADVCVSWNGDVSPEDAAHMAIICTKGSVIESIKQLPPTRPNLQQTCNQLATDCISRQAAIDVIDAIFPVDPMKSEYAQGIACGAALAKTYVEQLPSAQPEIIHCRDCIAYQEGIDIDGKPFTRCNGSVRTYGHTLPDWYCADAERRTDD